MEQKDERTTPSSCSRYSPQWLDSPLPVLAQEYRATLTGLVADAQGGVLPGATVTATHVETGTAHVATTEASGTYTFAFLTPGNYTIAAELQGFTRLVRENVRLSTGQRVTLDLKLEVGNMTESVTVQGEAALLSTGTASVGVVVDSAQIDSLPMSGRAPSSLIKLSAGVLDGTSPVANTRPFDNGGTSTFSMGGGQSRTNELLLDGGPNMAADRRISYNPPADIVQEIKIETFQSDASYGNSAAGTVNIVTKSGTNQFKGGAGFYTQPSGLSGTTYFTKRAGRTEPPFTYNQGGVTAGGPLVIPGLMDGRNRVFWIASYDNIRDSYVTPVTTTVPTEAMRNGDFSALLGLGDVYRIYDPSTAVAEGARRRRLPFPDNRIPADRINAIARNYLDFYPLPNQPGSADGTGNYLSPTTRSDTYYSLMGRTDINLNAHNRLMFKWYGNDREERKGNLFDNIGTGAILPRLNSGAMLDFVHTLNSTTMVNSRFGWTRFDDHETRESTGFDMTTLGFPASLAAASINPVLPMIAFGDTTASLGPDRRQRRRRGVLDGLRFLSVVHLGHQRQGRPHAQGRRRSAIPPRDVDQLRRLRRQLHVRHTVDARAARQLGRGAERPGVRVVPARAADRRAVRGQHRPRQSRLLFGLLRPGRLAACARI